MSGFEILREVREYNEQAAAEEEKRLDEPTRERVPVDMWRSLPDSPP